MEKQPNNFQAVTTKQAMELLNCSRTTFHERHKPKLKQYYKEGQTHYCLYDYNEVSKLAEEINKGKNIISDFTIVQKPLASMDVSLINGRWHVDKRPFSELTPSEVHILDNFFDEYKKCQGMK